MDVSEIPKDIIREAKIWRAFFEKYANKLKGMSKVSDKTLECYCAIASYFLWKSIKKLGYKDCHFVTGEYRYRDDHCWVKFQNFIIDITATQFGNYAPVYVVPASQAEKHIESHIDGTAIRALHKWPKDQTAFLKKHNPDYEKYLYAKLRKFMDTYIV